MGRHGYLAARSRPQQQQEARANASPVGRGGRHPSWCRCCSSGGSLSQEIHLTNVTESQRATTVLAERLRPDSDTELFLVSSATSSVDDPAFRAYVERLQAALQGLGPDVVVAAVTYYQTQDPSMVSADHRVTIVPTVLAGKVSDATKKVPPLRRVAAANRAPGFTVQLIGDEFARRGGGSDGAGRPGDRRGDRFVVALLFLVAALGGLVALGLPLVVDVALAAVALGLMALIGRAARFRPSPPSPLASSPWRWRSTSRCSSSLATGGSEPGRPRAGERRRRWRPRPPAGSPCTAASRLPWPWPGCSWCRRMSSGASPVG